MKTQICINQMTFWEWQTSEAKSTGAFLVRARIVDRCLRNKWERTELFY